MTLLAIAACLGWLWVAFVVARGATRVGVLWKERNASLPRLSIVIPACNEQDTLGPALTSLLASDYPDLEIILVNDRSTDATGDLMESMAASDPRLRVLHITELPDGWLGKNHAQHVGSHLASGEWLLFTDADVHYENDTLARALTLATRSGADHVCIGPSMKLHGFWESVFLSFFGTAFAFRYRPDLVHKPGPHYCGVGAFNLVRTSVYRQLGGHTTLALQVLDDMELGKLIKGRGFEQRFVSGGTALSVRWAEGLWGIARILEKNAFAGLNYSLAFTAFSTAVTVFACLAPIGLLWQGHWAWALLGWAAMGICGASNALGVRVPLWSGLFYPVAGLVFCFVLWRAAFIVSTKGGVTWRGTFYPLQQLHDVSP